ncbi:MAG: restriction endonuclease subunit S [Oscillospiraceae bacterium]|nr:restriction endonuclease subunit S [Oscillospiraceae bacterium]
MRDEIRERIEAWRRGEVPEGYLVENHQLRPRDWKYEKIGKFLAPHEEFSNDTEKYALATSSRQGLMPQTDYYSDQRYEETTGGFHVVPEDYITYRHMSDDDIFKFNLNSLGAPVLVSPEYPVFTTTDELNKYMLIEYLNGMKEFRAYCSAQKKGSTRTRMYFSRLSEFAMPIPPVAEQEQIAEILSACDRAIELKQKLVEELQSLKKTCLAKMFPREGSDAPEVRFPGFTEAWKERKLGALATFINGRAYSQDELLVSGKYRVLRVGNLYTNASWYYSDLELDDKFYADNGDLLYTWSASFGPHIWSGDRVIYHYHIWKIDLTDQLKKCFAVQLLEQDKEKLLSSKNGSAMVHVTKEGMERKTVSVPSRVEEQETIGAFLEKLDEDISLHQRELEAAQQKKKALMQLLLTGLVRVQV